MKLFAIISCLILFCIAGCKKDLLHYQNVTQLTSHADTDRLNKIMFINDSIGFVVGGQRFNDAVILTTRDGGATWATNSYPVAGKAMYDITLSPNGSIFAIGFDGKILFSGDTGRSWRFSQAFYYPYRGIACIDASHFILVGGISFGVGQIAIGDSSGHVTTSNDFFYQLNAVKMVNNRKGYISGFGIVLKTNDGGATWNILDVSGDNFTAMDVHDDEIWICGSNGSVCHSNDGGQHWDRLRNGNDLTIAHYALNDIIFKDGTQGWAVGDKGKVLHSDDGGKHWMEYDPFTTADLYCIAIAPNGSLIVGGDKGALYRISTP